MGGGEHLDSLKPVQEGGEAGCEREEGGVAGRREEQRDEEEEEIGHIIAGASFQTLSKTVNLVGIPEEGERCR